MVERRHRGKKSISRKKVRRNKRKQNKEGRTTVREEINKSRKKADKEKKRVTTGVNGRETAQREKNNI